MSNHKQFEDAMAETVFRFLDKGGVHPKDTIVGKVMGNNTFPQDFQKTLIREAVSARVSRIMKRQEEGRRYCGCYQDKETGVWMWGLWSGMKRPELIQALDALLVKTIEMREAFVLVFSQVNMNQRLNNRKPIRPDELPHIREAGTDLRRRIEKEFKNDARK